MFVDGVIMICLLSGILIIDVNLIEGNIYVLFGVVFVGGDNENSVMLLIDVGVMVYGVFGNDYLVVSCGLKIEVEGIVIDLIVFILYDDVIGGIMVVG